MLPLFLAVVRLRIDGAHKRSVLEGDSVDICVSKLTKSAQKVKFSLTPQDGTATGNNEVITYSTSINLGIGIQVHFINNVVIFTHVYSYSEIITPYLLYMLLYRS